MESRQDMRSNRTRQNNKRADRKMELIDSPEIKFQTEGGGGGGDIRRVRSPFGTEEQKGGF